MQVASAICIICLAYTPSH